jgi:hypothetical protein
MPRAQSQSTNGLFDTFQHSPLDFLLSRARNLKNERLPLARGIWTAS